MQTLKQYVDSYPVSATQADWAAFFEVSQPYFSQLLTGARSPSKRLMREIERKTRGAVPIMSWFLMEAQESGSDTKAA